MSKYKHHSRRTPSVTQALTPEALSALMDGYLPSSDHDQEAQVQQLLDQLLRDGDLAEQRRGDWHLYHRIGDVMRGELAVAAQPTVAPSQPESFAEPATVVSAKSALRKQPDHGRAAVNWPSWIATAAALVAVTWMLEVTDLGMSSQGERLASRELSTPTAAEWASPSVDWQEFVREHQQAGGMALPTAGSAAVFRSQIDAVRVEHLLTESNSRYPAPTVSSSGADGEGEAWYRLWDQPLRFQKAPGSVH